MKHRDYIAKVCRIGELRIEDGERDLEVTIYRGGG
jgi:hypothetical protein